jgi:L-amino acid N-acyltransferase YncA
MNNAVECRLATATDAEALQRIYAPFVAETPISFELEPPDTAEMSRRLRSALPLPPFLVAVDAGTVVGYPYGGSHSARPRTGGRSTSPCTSTPAGIGQESGGLCTAPSLH